MPHIPRPCWLDSCVLDTMGGIGGVGGAESGEIVELAIGLSEGLRKGDTLADRVGEGVCGLGSSAESDGRDAWSSAIRAEMHTNGPKELYKWVKIYLSRNAYKWPKDNYNFGCPRFQLGSGFACDKNHHSHSQGRPAPDRDLRREGMIILYSTWFVLSFFSLINYLIAETCSLLMHDSF